MSFRLPIICFYRCWTATVTALLLFAATGLGQAVTANEENRDISISVSVTDKNGVFVDDIEKNRFVVLANGKEQEVLESTSSAVPFSVGILTDTSGSMKGHGQLAVAGFTKFLENSNDANEYFVMQFAKANHFALDYSTNQEVVISTISEAYESGVEGNTHLLEAISMAIEKLGSSAYKDRVLLVFSDGGWVNSIKLEHLKKWFEDNHVRVYFVNAVALKDKLIMEFSYTSEVMNRFAVISGGTAFFMSEPEDFLDSFSRVALEMKNLYRLRFRLDQKTFDRARKKGSGIDLKVKIIREIKNGKKSPKLKAVTRKKVYVSNEILSPETK